MKISIDIWEDNAYGIMLYAHMLTFAFYRLTISIEVEK